MSNLDKDMDEAYEAHLAATGERHPMDAFFDHGAALMTVSTDRIPPDEIERLLGLAVKDPVLAQFVLQEALRALTFSPSKGAVVGQSAYDSPDLHPWVPGVNTGRLMRAIQMLAVS